MTPAQPSCSACRAKAITSRVEPAFVPATTGTRPAAASRVVLITCSRSPAVERVKFAGAAQRNQSVDALADQVVGERPSRA